MNYRLVIVKPNRIGPFPFPKSDPKTRWMNFSEVQQPYTREQAIMEANRCILCGNPICIDACPVQMDVRGMCEAVSRGDIKKAYNRIRKTNSLLGLTARCCPQLQELCEEACVMRWQGQPISIGMIQRFVSDWEKEASNVLEPSSIKETGKHVSIIGAGPAGLAAADYLKDFGHSVTIFEELPTPGGTAWYGIPDYHVPKDILLYEIEKLKKRGVIIKAGIKVGKDVTLNELKDKSDAVLITTGSKDVPKLDTLGIDLEGVIDGYKFLEDVYLFGIHEYLKAPKYDLGKEILVIGGGNTAIDCARTARRLSKNNVTIIYRRSENEMPADPFIVEEAQEEGIKIKFLTNPKSYNGINGKLENATMLSMKLTEPDNTGRKHPVPIPGKDFTMKCDNVILSVGRGPNSFLQKKAGLKMGKKNSIAIDEHYQTSEYGVFAAGDVITGETLVVRAMGHGRESAQRIHEFIMGLEKEHNSLYEKYYIERTSSSFYQKMLMGE